MNLGTGKNTDNSQQLALKNAMRYPKKAGKAEYMRFLRGEHLTRDEAIKARCYECVGGEDADPCNVKNCALTLYCQWNR